MLSQKLSLAAWKVSKNVWQQEEFQTGLQNLCQIPEEEAQFFLTNGPGISDLAGVMNRKLIPFDVM